MIKKLLLSLLIITGIGASAAVGTQALLSDQAILTANTFSTGTVDLQVATGKTTSSTPSTIFADTNVGFSGTILPGETKTEFFRLKNNGTGVDFSIAAQATNLGGTINSDDISITITPIDTSAGDGVAEGLAVTKTLTVWNSTPGSLSTPNIESGDTQRYRMNVTLAPGVTLSGASTIFDFVFTGTQVTP